MHDASYNKDPFTPSESEKFRYRFRFVRCEWTLKGTEIKGILIFRSEL